MLVAFILWINPLNVSIQPFLMEFGIEPGWPPSFWRSLGSPVDRDVALSCSFPVVLTNLPGIVGCICRDDRGMILDIQNCKYFEDWFVGLGIVDICWGNGTGKRDTVSIDQSAQLVPVHLPITAIVFESPFSPGYPWCRWNCVRNRLSGSHTQTGEGR